MPFIILDGKRIEYELKESKKASRMRLSVSYGGKLTVTKPERIGIWQMELFMKKKASWIMKKIDFMKDKHFDPLFHGSGKKEYKKQKEKARKLAFRKIEYFNSFYGFDFGKVSIRNQKSRWGSCSEKRNLSFNFRIIFLPENLLDCIIVHELCHLGELNHSGRFWNLMEKTIPNSKKLSKSLKNI